ncbi:MAG: TonB-dependent receptor [Candidatus Neomarinimicrobiota bacterium]|nr:MAG: TonB-dependent receptor [Candidatus Neomarinimicrobiota bacterium]
MKSSIKISYLCFFIFSIALGSDNQSSVNGTVYKDGTKIPLQGANVLFINEAGGEFGASTDANGRYAIGNMPGGDYTVTISFIGYDDYSKSIMVKNGKKYQIDATLSVEPILMAKLEIISEIDAPYQDLPGAATVMYMQTLKLVNPIGTQEMLEYVPGINGFADDGIGNSRISIGIRGLNPRRSSRVLILEDGVPIQPALYVYPNMYYNPPADRIDQIEVIKGSGSILYGPQTMGGVINYFTRRPRSDYGGSFKITGGENGYESLFAELGGWGNEKYKPEFQLLAKRGDGFRQNNSFEQLNGTFKLNIRNSDSKNTYMKLNLNYENSNATYTGLTEWSFNNDPRFNPKEDDNFKVFRSAFDLMQSEKLSSNLTKSTTFFTSYFDRKWWRENDIFIKASDLYTQDGDLLDLDTLTLDAKPYYSPFNLVRVGNGIDNFGILRTFYVAGLERSYKLKHDLFNRPSNMETGLRVYWERFVDDRKTGFTSDSVYATDAREGVYFRGSGDSLEILGTSHHYETMALSGFLSESIDLGSLNIRPGIRLELFEQERVDRMQGSIYQDKTIFVLLPGIAFSKSVAGMNLFGGIHRGFTPPSSGALKILNFGEGLDDSGLDLDAEKSWNKELGVRGTLSLVEYEIAGFHIDIENLVAAGRGTAFQNLGKVASQGVESRMGITLSQISSLLPDIHVAYTFLHTEVKDGAIISNVSGSAGSETSINGKELPYSPNHTVTAGLEFKPISNLQLRTDFRFVGEAYTDFENIVDTDAIGISGPIQEYGIFNISGSYLIRENFKLFFSGKNITDEVYIGSRLHSNPGYPEANISSGIIPGPRRQINVGVEYSF